MLTLSKSLLKKIKDDRSILDVAEYGSAVKGKLGPKDIDLIIIFRQTTLKERLEKIQELKKEITDRQKLDLKGILWEELFSESFFARSGIILEGISLIDGKPIAAKLDFQASTLFIHDLKNKPHTEKVKFNYILRGRSGMGFIERLKGTHLAPGVVQIPIASSLEFEEMLNTHNIQFTKKNILCQN